MLSEPVAEIAPPLGVLRKIAAARESLCAAAAGDDRRSMWDQEGALKKLGGKESSSGDPVVVPLNESNPTLGRLDPPHSPRDRRPRLEIAFGVNADRWLCATVEDLRTKSFIMQEEPVVRLL